MKRICLISTVSMTLEAFVLDAVKTLHEIHPDWEITFACRGDDRFAASLPPYIRFVPIRMERGISLSGLTAVSQMKKLFSENRFDLVQYATPNASLYASIAAKQTKVPVRLYCQWGIRYVGFEGMARRVFKRLEKTVCRNSTHIRAVSFLNKRFAVEEGLYPEEKAVVLGQGGTIGVDLEEYDLSKKEEWREKIRSRYQLGDGVVFGFVGRISRDKGSGELLAAFRSIHAHNPSAKLLMVGSFEMDESMDRELLDWAKACPDVVFTGRIDKHDLRMYYAATDVYVHPSYREGFGMVLQEAAAMGCAVVTTAIPGASEVMEEGISCLLAQPKDRVGLEGGMTAFLRDPELRLRFGRQARRRVETYFDRKKMVQAQCRDYERLLEETT